VRRHRRIGDVACAVVSAIAVTGFARVATRSSDVWNAEERATLRTLSIANAGSPPADPSNRYADDPRVASLGRRLFFDSSLSANGKVACATCHLLNREFQDGLPLGRGVGVTGRRTMTIVGTSHSPWFFWDGRSDSQWSQALGPLESAVEHGGTRTLYARVISRDYRAMYEQLFGPLPSLATVPRSAGPNGNSAEREAWSALPSETRDSITRVFVNIGKSIAAFERGIQYGPSRFDKYVAHLSDSSSSKPAASDLSPTEVAGLRTFLGRGRCIRCHTGPLFTDNQFHNVGLAPRTGLNADSGRIAGVRQALAGEFNCLGAFSDAKPSECGELTFVVKEGPELVQAFRTPSLRNVARRPPFGHAGQFPTLAAVLEHYNHAPSASAGHSELEPLRLSATELRQLEAFLRALNGPVIVPSLR
jgi:cytochrome c peroxidase